tara:strand:+ start:184076 stop:185164 length:1089 start_codon:yes stop_codon:yes gene_type:complete
LDYDSGSDEANMSDNHQQHSCHPVKGKADYLLLGSTFFIVIFYFQYAFFTESANFAGWYQTLASTVFEMMNTIWWGVVLGFLMISVLSRIPREFVLSILGAKKGFNGIFRATMAGVLLDLCNHGILMVGAKLYERGASTGQVMAFLIASPWNSFSLTLIMFGLIGVPWTLAFIVLSMLIAIISGLIFDTLVTRNVLPKNAQRMDLPEGFVFWEEANKQLKQADYSIKAFRSMLINGAKESRMVVRWIFFGVLLAGLIRAFVPTDVFQTFFGASLAGLGLTLVAATIIEVCSEGSTPIAADLLNRANAPGNSFAFLMTGVSTDYTEIMVLREATRSWKIPLFLPLITVPQIILVSWLINLGAA